PFVPAKAGTQCDRLKPRCKLPWVPAFAGTNGGHGAASTTALTRCHCLERNREDAGEHHGSSIILCHGFRERARLLDEELRDRAQRTVPQRDDGDGASMAAQFDG